MLPKKFRLTIVEFYKNPQHAKRFLLPFFIIMLKASQIGNPRFCVSVPKFLDKRSSHRHETKRIIIEIIRKKLTKIGSSIDVVIKLRRIIDKKDKIVVDREIDRIFGEKGLLKL
jgi:ribonuclease P protein component